MTEEEHHQTPEMTAEEFSTWWYGFRGREPGYYDDEHLKMAPERCYCEHYPFPHWVMGTHFE